jgi:hypothetical protein
MKDIVVKITDDNLPSTIIKRYAPKIGELPSKIKIETIIRRILTRADNRAEINWTLFDYWSLLNHNSLNRVDKLIKTCLLEFNKDEVEVNGEKEKLFDNFSIKTMYNLSESNYPNYLATGYVDDYCFQIFVGSKSRHPHMIVSKISPNNQKTDLIVSIKDYFEWLKAKESWLGPFSRSVVVGVDNELDDFLNTCIAWRSYLPKDITEKDLSTFNGVLKGGLNSFWWARRLEIEADLDYFFEVSYFGNLGVKISDGYNFEIIKLDD